MSVDQPVPLAISIGIASYPHDSAEQGRARHARRHRAVRGEASGRRARPAGDRAGSRGRSTQSLGFGLLQGLLNAIAHKDPYTRRHCEDNVRYVDLVAERLNLTAEATESLRKAALLHDVGKIAIPDQTLLKPGPLDSNEWEVMQQHVRFGEMIVKGIAQISDAIEPVATHHERFDGKGYPRGLKGERYTAAGAHPRRRRRLLRDDAGQAVPKGAAGRAAIEELRKGAGTQFDPEVVDAFLDALQIAASLAARSPSPDGQPAARPPLQQAATRQQQALRFAGEPRVQPPRRASSPPRGETASWR